MIKQDVKVRPVESPCNRVNGFAWEIDTGVMQCNSG